MYIKINKKDALEDLEFIEAVLNKNIKRAKENNWPFGELTLAKFRTQKMIVELIRPGAIYMGAISPENCDKK